jgi:hypothetical protein
VSKTKQATKPVDLVGGPLCGWTISAPRQLSVGDFVTINSVEGRLERYQLEGDHSAVWCPATPEGV